MRERNEMGIQKDTLRFVGRLNALMEAGLAPGSAGELFGGDFGEQAYATLADAVKSLPTDKKMRLFAYAAKAARGDMADRLERDSFRCVLEAIREGTPGVLPVEAAERKKNGKVERSLALRVNWCGSWTDTPPYCLENGGAVVNAAVAVNGIKPVKVTVEKIDEPQVVLEYFDSGDRGVYTRGNLAELSNTKEPFPLLKSALMVCGIVPMPGNEAKKDVFDRLGSGLSVSTGVIGIPKGSGLGTSSILLAACVKALFAFTGQRVTDAEVTRRVLLAEQLMGTGGGWQDQAGGMTGGIKLASSKPGFRQDVECEPLKAPASFIKELGERFCLVYSGRRRIGRTVLRQIMGGYIRNEQAFTGTLGDIHALALPMKQCVTAGDMDGFIARMNTQNELTKKLDTGYMNSHIEKILQVSGDLISSKMMCGAGGGGFIQFILKKGCSPEDLSARLKAAFPGEGIDVWECGFI